MSLSKQSLFFILFIAGLNSILAGTTLAANFGKDDRVMVTPSSVEYPLARSTAVGVLNSLIAETSPGRYQIYADPASDILCRDQKFANQTSIAYACSGFLVAPDLLVTAGHCSVNVGETKNETGLFCEAYSSWVFDYSLERNGNIAQEVSQDNHYRCKQIIYAVSDKDNDYSLIQLDRPVKNRTPLVLSKAPLKIYEKLKMIGHPFGLPTVLSKNATILKNDSSKQSFLTNLDAFAGNSGSAVFNKKNEVVGILIGGTPSENLIIDKKMNCGRVNHCDEKGENCALPDYSNDGTVLKDMGSEVQRIEPVIEHILEFEKQRAKKQ